MAVTHVRPRKYGREASSRNATAVVAELVKAGAVCRSEAALQLLKRALARGPIADPAAYLQRLIDFRNTGDWRRVTLPAEPVDVARAKALAGTPWLDSGRFIGGYRPVYIDRKVFNKSQTQPNMETRGAQRSAHSDVSGTRSGDVSKRTAATSA